MTVIILISVAIGMLFGFFVIRDVFADNMADFEYWAGLIVKAGLTVLLFLYRYRPGPGRYSYRKLHSCGRKDRDHTNAVILGTLIGAAAMSIFIGVSVKRGPCHRSRFRVVIRWLPAY